MFLLIIEPQILQVQPPEIAEACKTLQRALEVSHILQNFKCHFPNTKHASPPRIHTFRIPSRVESRTPAHRDLAPVPGASLVSGSPERTRIKTPMGNPTSLGARRGKSHLGPSSWRSRLRRSASTESLSRRRLARFGGLVRARMICLP